MKHQLHFSGLTASFLCLLATAAGCGDSSTDQTSGSGGTGAGGGGAATTTGSGGSGGATTGTGGAGATGGSTGTAGGGACDDYQGQATATEIALSPFANKEAEILALEATGKLIAPQHAYERILADLALIRSQHPQVQNAGAMASWPTDQLLMGFDAEGMTAVQNGTYADWDCPNALYGVTSKDVTSFVNLHFSHRFNIPLLAAEYAALPHVEYAEPNGFAGDGSDVCASIEGGTTYHYVFDIASGDCQAGCINHEYWGFTTTKDSPSTATALGTFKNDIPGQPPAWYTALGACTKWL